MAVEKLSEILRNNKDRAKLNSLLARNIIVYVPGRQIKFVNLKFKLNFIMTKLEKSSEIKSSISVKSLRLVIIIQNENFSFDTVSTFRYSLLKDITRTECWIKMLSTINDVGLFLIPLSESWLKSLNIYGG